MLGPLQTVTGSGPDQGWLDLESIATVEVTSEDPAFPIEAAFDPENPGGWRASLPGEQFIRILFDQPRTLRRIQIRFQDQISERTQEFRLCWADEAGALKEIVRQQWNFSPAGSTLEVEDYRVELDGVAMLELSIKPEIGGREAIASLASWRLA
jgi:hypothetical protein